MEGSRTDEQPGTNGASAPSTPFVSKLPKGPQRFLAYVLEHSLQHGRRTAHDFIRHFPPAAIMKALENEPQLRANIIVMTTGTHMKVALKKSAESCGTDLQIALEEDEADVESVVTLFQPDDRVRFLDNRALWVFLTEGAFWQTDPNKDRNGYTTAASHLTYMIERALEEQMLSHRQVLDGITVAKLAIVLPREALAQVVQAALDRGRAGKPFVDSSLLDVATIHTLAEHVPLPWLWNEVIVPHIAEAHGLAEAAGAKAGAKEAKAKAAEAQDDDLDLEVDDVLNSLTRADEPAKPGGVQVPRPNKGNNSVPPGP